MSHWTLESVESRVLGDSPFLVFIQCIPYDLLLDMS